VPHESAFYRSRSFWLDSLEDDALAPRPALAGDTQVDVAIVGAGYTGLWTAYELRRRDPGMRIALLEAEIAGFGASGRNGGWCSAFLPMSLTRLAERHGHDAAVRMRRAMEDTIDEVGKVSAAEGIDCHFAKGGHLHVATNPAHLARLHADLDEARRFGATAEDARWLERGEMAERVRVAGALGAVFTPHCAALHPARLARGLARVVERAGVSIHEHTPVRAIEPRRVTTDHGVVRADVVVRATEGYTRTLAGERRTLAPIYSLMIATSALPASFWDEVGWVRRETLNDARQLIIYAQRTADDRIAFGGRGAPYHFASAIDPAFDVDSHVHAGLRALLGRLFPALGDAQVTHRWGGPLGVPRDWHSAVHFDRATGLAWAGGYVGDGVATTNLAGRTLADLITGRDSDLTRLPWVGHRSPRWEPEPLRWLGINAALRLPAAADRHEVCTGRPARARSWLLERLLRR
ncbi:MAG TPA: FAD-binding oxidoreductase, partial [Acidimicrobiales bacterium]|nr:FAD-binding oxidoreductase [Acidimicrobiales bacterium]